jgi:hypothetical protein
MPFMPGMPSNGNTYPQIPNLPSGYFPPGAFPPGMPGQMTCEQLHEMMRNMNCMETMDMENMNMDKDMPETNG